MIPTLKCGHFGRQLIAIGRTSVYCAPTNSSVHKDTAVIAPDSCQQISLRNLQNNFIQICCNQSGLSLCFIGIKKS